jgi:hypothetical protein
MATGSSGPLKASLTASTLRPIASSTGSTVGSDFASIFGGDFDPDSISASGMSLFNASQNPHAIGDLLTKFQELNYTVVFFWRQSQSFSASYLTLMKVDDSAAVEIGAYSGAAIASDENGDFNTVGTVRTFSDNVLAVSFNADGMLASLNGETAVLSEPQVTALIDVVEIGQDGSSEWLEGWLKAIIFYDATDAAGVEAYSANAAPVNTVAPAITGTAQVGQVLSVSNGTWTDTPTSYEYQWYRDNFNGSSAVDGATASTFTPTVAELGVTMKCVVYALNADGIGGIGVSDDETVIAA